MRLSVPASLRRVKSRQTRSASAALVRLPAVAVRSCAASLSLSRNVQSLFYEDALNGRGIREKAAGDIFREFRDQETRIPRMLESLGEAANLWLNELHVGVG
jgi:hypothetical protein